MLYMVIEEFNSEDVPKIYARLEKQGRMIPNGLEYVDSWVDIKRTCCFQLMKTDKESLLQEWMSSWDDIVEFKVFPVIHSSEMQKIAFRENNQNC